VYTRIDYLRTGELFGNIYVPPVHLELCQFPLPIPVSGVCPTVLSPSSSSVHSRFIRDKSASRLCRANNATTARRPYSRTFSCVRDYCIRQYACDCILVFGCFQNKISSVAFLIPMPILRVFSLNHLVRHVFYFLLYIIRRFSYHGNA